MIGFEILPPRQLPGREAIGRDVGPLASGAARRKLCGPDKKHLCFELCIGGLDQAWAHMLRVRKIDQCWKELDNSVKTESAGEFVTRFSPASSAIGTTAHFRRMNALDEPCASDRRSATMPFAVRRTPSASAPGGSVPMKYGRAQNGCRSFPHSKFQTEGTGSRFKSKTTEKYVLREMGRRKILKQSAPGPGAPVRPGSKWISSYSSPAGKAICTKLLRLSGLTSCVSQK